MNTTKLFLLMILSIFFISFVTSQNNFAYNYLKIPSFGNATYYQNITQNFFNVTQNNTYYINTTNNITTINNITIENNMTYYINLTNNITNNITTYINTTVENNITNNITYINNITTYINETFWNDTGESLIPKDVRNVTSRSWFKGLFDWFLSITNSNYLSGNYNGSTLTLTLDDSRLNNDFNQTDLINIEETERIGNDSYLDSIKINITQAYQVFCYGNGTNSTGGNCSQFTQTPETDPTNQWQNSSSAVSIKSNYPQSIAIGSTTNPYSSSFGTTLYSNSNRSGNLLILEDNSTSANSEGAIGLQSGSLSLIAPASGNIIFGFNFSSTYTQVMMLNKDLGQIMFNSKGINLGFFSAGFGRAGNLIFYDNAGGELWKVDTTQNTTTLGRDNTANRHTLKVFGNGNFTGNNLTNIGTVKSDYYGNSTNIYTIQDFLNDNTGSVDFDNNSITFNGVNWSVNDTWIQQFNNTDAILTEQSERIGNDSYLENQIILNQTDLNSKILWAENSSNQATYLLNETNDVCIGTGCSLVNPLYKLTIIGGLNATGNFFLGDYMKGTVAPNRITFFKDLYGDGINTTFYDMVANTVTANNLCYGNGLNSTGDQCFSSSTDSPFTNDSLNIYSRAGYPTNLNISGNETISGLMTIGDRLVPATIFGVPYGTSKLFIRSNAENDGIRFQQDWDGALGVVIGAYQNSSSPAENDELLRIISYGNDANGDTRIYGQIEYYLADPTAGNSDGLGVFRAENGGGLANFLAYGLLKGNSGVFLDYPLSTFENKDLTLTTMNETNKIVALRNVEVNGNLTLNNLAKLNSINLPECNGGLDGSIGRNATSIYYCNSTNWRQFNFVN